MTGYLRKTILTGFAALILGLGLSGPAMADSHEIKFRQSVMKSVGGAMGGLAAVLKGQASAEHANALSHVMYNLSLVVPHVFPEGSDFGETEALIVIWQKPADFKIAVQNFQSAALNLSKVTHGGDMQAFGQAFGALGKACKDCHENFRKKKEK
ncbi:MAG: cytochrome c [Rhodospirillaceae bacterium]|nr:cytochrome c [Rhodospirillaceae bacterium]